VRPFKTVPEWENWFNVNAEEFGVKPLMVSVSLRTMRFTHQGASYRIDHGALEGAIEVADTERLMRRLLRGFGSHRRLGLGMMKLQS
jgi:hypothetical protein